MTLTALSDLIGVAALAVTVVAVSWLPALIGG